MGVLLIIVLLCLCVGAFPAWPHAANWGYYPFGGVGLVLVIIVILAIMGRI